MKIKSLYKRVETDYAPYDNTDLTDEQKELFIKFLMEEIKSIDPDFKLQITQFSKWEDNKIYTNIKINLENVSWTLLKQLFEVWVDYEKQIQENIETITAINPKEASFGPDKTPDGSEVNASQKIVIENWIEDHQKWDLNRQFTFNSQWLNTSVRYSVDWKNETTGEWKGLNTYINNKGD